MEIFFWCIGIGWCIGWVCEYAKFHADMDKQKAPYPYEAMKYAVPVLLFFTWPYFYFYRKGMVI